MFRICIGVLALINQILIGLDWDAWFGERGFVPAAVNLTWIGGNVPLWEGGPLVPRLNLLSGVTNPIVAQGFFWLVAVFAFLTAIGLWTRLSSICLALGVVSLQHRNAIILHGGDSIIRLAVMYLALSPCGAACSVDRLIAIWKGTAPQNPIVQLWVQRLLNYNLALVYITTVWCKRFGVHWVDGTATWYTSRLPEFYRFPVPTFLLHPPMIQVETYATIVSEFALGTLIFFRPFRTWVIVSGIILHGWIEYSMNIPLFSYLMFSMYLCFYDGEEVSAWAVRIGAKLKPWSITVKTPRGMAVAPQAASFLNAVDPFQLVRYETGMADDWTAERTDGRSVSPAIGTLARSLGAWGFLVIPWAWKKLLVLSVASDPKLAKP